MQISSKHIYIANIPFYILASVFMGIGVLVLKSAGILAGGLPGVALLVNSLWGGLSIGSIIILLNMPILIFAYMVRGAEYTIGTILSMTLMSLVIDIFQFLFLHHIPNFTDSVLYMGLASILAGICLGIGLWLFVYKKSNSGGLMIVAHWMSEKYRFPLPYYIFIQDGSILIWGLLTILSFPQFLYSILCMLFLSLSMHICIFIVEKRQ